MSRIHQAIRKAEQEQQNAPVSPETSSTRNLLRKTQDIPQIPETENQRQQALPDNPAATATAEITELPCINQPAPITGVVSEVVASSKIESLRTDTSLQKMDPLLSPLLNPQSIPSEQYRMLKTRLFKLSRESELKVILVTSASPGDGKSLTAANLALAMSQEMGQKVMLIDCDFRKPSAHKLFGLKCEKGLANYLMNDSASQQDLAIRQISNLHFLPVGSLPEKPAELLNSGKMQEYLSQIRHDYQWIILDSPPLELVADAETLSSLADGVLMVVRARQDSRSHVEKCPGKIEIREGPWHGFQWSRHYRPHLLFIPICLWHRTS